MPGYNTAQGTFMMSERRGFFCRYECVVDGRQWYVIPKSASSLDDQKTAIAERDAHEIASHGALFLVFVPLPTGPFNQTFSRKKAT